ncbi:AraC family transcriptional regulator [Streptomyces sp. NPDC004629]|uniref:AraC family transcriptional regulator n=1 Tax=Streptomyces sp. NPDC004629 TaxID=3364705 RepID=UPI0036A1D231
MISHVSRVRRHRGTVYHQSSVDDERVSDMADPLADLMRLIRPHAVLWKRIEGADRWAIRFPANSDITFGTVTRGHCLLLGCGPALELAQGDFLLLSGPQAAFTFSSDPDTAPVDGEMLMAQAPDKAVTVGAGAGRTCQLVGGHFLIDATNAHLLRALIPGRIHCRGADPGTGRISHLLDLIGDEAASDRPGAGYVLPRLVEVMLVEALRGHGPSGPEIRSEGLLSGLADPQVSAALHAMHAEVRRPWTVAELAATAHMSRSVFAERFSERVGTTPMEYLLAWRMALAKDALRRGDQTLTGIAHAVGYGSASAFSNAFRRSTGLPPGRYATAQRTPTPRNAAHTGEDPHGTTRGGTER